MQLNLLNGDCLPLLKTLPANSVDSIITDPPYGLTKLPDINHVLSQWLQFDDYEHDQPGFMNKEWDSFVPAPCVWRQCLRVLKPGGHLMSFFGARTYDLGSMAIRLAGFEVRDQIMWIYGSGFPKNHDITKAIRKIDPDYPISGLGTALKPAHEPICVARKPFKDSLTDNVLIHGVGSFHIDNCRTDDEHKRWPANVVHDGSDAVLSHWPQSSVTGRRSRESQRARVDGTSWLMNTHQSTEYHDSGNVARYFYCAKPDRKDRDEGLMSSTMMGIRNIHPTVKPTKLMNWLCKLVTPKGGVILDPFMGSGSTGKAAMINRYGFIGMEREKEYFNIACKRIFFQRDIAGKNDDHSS